MKRRQFNWMTQGYSFGLYLLFSIIIALGGFLAYISYLPTTIVFANNQFIYIGVFFQLLFGGITLYLGRLSIRTLMQRWLSITEDRIRQLQSILKESILQEEIPHMLLSIDYMKGREQREVESAKQLLYELREFIANVRTLTFGATRTISEEYWYKASKLFYRIGIWCSELGRPELAEKIKLLYLIVNWLLWRSIFLRLFRSFANAVFFLIGFLIINRLMERIFVFGGRFGQDWLTPVFIIALGLFVAQFIPIVSQYSINWFLEKTQIDFWESLIDSIWGPFSMVMVAAVVYLTFRSLPISFVNDVENLWSILTSTVIMRILIIITIAWFSILFLNRISTYILRRWAERSEQRIDITFVVIVQMLGWFIILVVAVGLILINLQPQIGATGNSPISNNILLAFSGIVSVLSAFLGYAFRKPLEDFFGGIMLLIDMPFGKGERLILETGEICDVREIGLRYTVLYNIVDKLEISIPNSAMAAQKITNVSRPDLQTRIQIEVTIPNEAYTLARAEEILLDIAYSTPDIDQARIRDDELSPQLTMIGRRSVFSELKSLELRYPQILNVQISQKNPGYGYLNWSVFPYIYDRLEQIIALRRKYGELREFYFEIFSLDRQDLEKFALGIDAIRLERITTEIVHRAVSESTKKLPKQAQNGRLREIMDELSGRLEVVDGHRKEIGKLADVILILSQRIEKMKNRPRMSLPNAIQIISDFIREQEVMRTEIMRLIKDQTSSAANAILAIADAFPDIRQDMEGLINELDKEPTVSSQFLNSDNGPGRVELTLNAYTTHFDRRFEITNELNQEIQSRFSVAGINTTNTTQ